MAEKRKHSVFISHSHRDRAWLERLQVHLKPLERAGLLDRWDDSRIQAGERWHDEIRSGLAQADVAILLISADFLASDFIVSEELPALLAAEQERGLCILSVVLKPCRLAVTPLAAIQAVHPTNCPLIQMSEAEQEAVWTKLADEIERGVARAAQRTPAAPPAQPQAAAGVWALPFELNPFFTGREELLTGMRDRLVQHGRLILSGLGGIGKTQLAVAYAYRFREHYRHVFWARAGTEAELVSSFAEIARLLGLAESQEAEQKRAVEAARRWFDQHDGWLLILDNAHVLESVKEFRPRNRTGHLVVTSRRRGTHGLGIADPLAVNELSPAEAFEFLHRRTGRRSGEPSEDRAVAELARELGHLPLALEQAAAYIMANQARFLDYLRGYRRRRLGVLTAPVAGDYPESVTTTWTLNFREVAQIPEAADLLRVSAFLGPAPIPLELIARGAAELGPALATALAPIAEDPLVLDEALEPLYRYSLVRRDVASRTYSILPIMQTVLLDGMDGDLQRQWAERTVRALRRAFPAPEPEHWDACERLIPHAQACAKLNAKWGFDFPEAISLLQDAATYLRRRARFTEATELQEQLLSWCERALNPEHPRLAETLVNLSKLHRLRGRYQDAEPLLQRALAIAEKADGPQHLEVARILNTLAALYQNMGRTAEAEPLARRSLTLREAGLGPRHREVAKSLTTLAVILRDLGRCEEAEQLLRRSVEIEERTLGSAHPSLASSLTRLAELCRLRQGYPEAELLLRRALALDEKALGPTHPNVAFALAGLAELFVQQNRLDEAETLYRRALEVREKALGADHPTVRETRQRYEALLGSVAQKSGGATQK